MPTKKNLTENIDLDWAIYDPEYRHAVMDQLKAEQQMTTAGIPSAGSGWDEPGEPGTPRAAGED